MKRKTWNKMIIDRDILSYLYLEKYLKRQIERIRERARAKKIERVRARARKKSSLQAAYPIVNRL